MPFIPTPSGLRVVFTGRYANAPFVNVMYARQIGGSPASVANLDTWAGALASLYHTTLMTMLNVNTHLTNVTATDISSEFGNQGVFTGDLVATGPATGGDPANVAVVLSWTIQRHYRGGHPRTYLVGISDTQHTEQSLTPASQTAYAAAGNNFRTGWNGILLGGSPTQISSLTKIRAGVPINPYQLNDITNCVVHQRLDSQRRRLGKEIV